MTRPITSVEPKYLMAVLSVISMPAGLISPVFAAWIFDVTGSYRLAWQIIGVVTLPAIILILIATPPKPQKKGEPATHVGIGTVTSSR